MEYGKKRCKIRSYVIVVGILERKSGMNITLERYFIGVDQSESLIGRNITKK